MTFAEIILFIAVLIGLTYLMKPLQRRLESRLYKFFRARSKSKEGRVVDITDYSKNKKDPPQ